VETSTPSNDKLHPTGVLWRGAPRPG